MPRTHRPLTVTALMLSMFLAAMEATAVSTAMPTVIGDLGGVELYAWVFTVYMLTSTVTVPIYGKLSDLFGRKPVLLFGLTLFLIGSILSGLATSIMALIVFRALQGLGAGAIQTTGLTIVGDIFELKERGRVQGLFAAVWGFSGIVGPLLGGLIVKYFSWHWIFFINVPFGLASIIVLTTAYHEKVEKRQRTLDIAGAVLLTGGVLALLTGVNGTSHGLVLTLAGIALLVAFFFVEKRTPEALLPLDLFSQSPVLEASLASMLGGAAMFTTVTYIPLFIQGVTFGSPTEAGAALTPMLVGWPLASTLAGRLIPRFGFKRFVTLGSLILALAAFGMALSVAAHVNDARLMITTAFFGVGLGLINTSIIIAVQTTVPWDRRGVATASTLFFRAIGGTLAVGILGGVLRLTLANAEGISSEMINQLLSSHGEGFRVDPATATLLSTHIGSALTPIFWATFAFGIVTAVIGARFPKDESVAASSPRNS